MARGSEWNDTAKAPTTRKRASAADNSRSTSRKSGFTDVSAGEEPGVHREPPRLGESRVPGDRFPELALEPVVGLTEGGDAD